MSLNAAMIQMMVDKGLSAQDIADIAKAGEAKTDRTAADRQARYRERKRGKRNAVTSRRDPPIDNNHTPGDISPDGENHQDPRHRDADWPEFDDWLPAEPWNAYLEMRRRKKAWPTAKAVGLILADLRKWRAKGHDPGSILNTSTVSNWTGIFEPKGTSNDRKSASTNEHTNPYVRAAIDGAAQREAERAGAEF